MSSGILGPQIQNVGHPLRWPLQTAAARNAPGLKCDFSVCTCRSEHGADRPAAVPGCRSLHAGRRRRWRPLHGLLHVRRSPRSSALLLHWRLLSDRSEHEAQLGFHVRGQTGGWYGMRDSPVRKDIEHFNQPWRKRANLLVKQSIHRGSLLST